ncbi:MAG: hypothetical protein PHD19_02025 [Dechloromonas sp.]|uniref:hypothetical protein n=1 Tax=Azonexus sp. TaxID=1872668 RepID=UPI0035B1CD9B|nr:hypothetical protein [Dechloromonas sp.]
MCATKTHPECRRKGEDRRKSDAGPPAGWAERRRSVERRLPEVVELPMSVSHWQEYFRAYIARLTGASPTEAALPEWVLDQSSSRR